MNIRKSIPEFDMYEVLDGVIVKSGTNKPMTVTDGTVQLRGDDGKRGKRDVAKLIEASGYKAQEESNGKSGMSNKIREAYKDGLSRKEISTKMMPNQGYVDNVIYRMNFKDNEEAIKKAVSDGVASKEICEKYDIAPRFIPSVT